MRRILAASFALVVCLGIAPATAGHTNDVCSTSALFVTDTMGASCPMILNCPAASLTCTWNVTISAQGIGHVRAYLRVLDNGQTVAACGPDSLECTHAVQFHLSPTQVVNAECWLFGGEVHPALLAGVECSAVAAGHVG